MGVILEEEIKKVLAENAKQVSDRPLVIKGGYHA
jgi:hypothetical protein